MKVELWILRSILASSLQTWPKKTWPRSSSIAVLCILLFLLVNLHLALCSRRLPPGRHAHAEKCAQSMLRLTSFTRKSVHYFYESPLYFGRVSSCRQVPLVEFLERSITKSSSLSRARGGGGFP